MDPISLLAGIAGIATAGVSLSRALYNLITSIRGTPKEISDIAREISDLSMIMSELRRVLKDGSGIYRRKLLCRVRSAVRWINTIYEALHDLIDGVDGLARLKWLFRKSKAMGMLYQTESHKNGINMILHIMTLAI